MVLEGAGFGVLEAGTAEDGLDTLAREDVDLVLLDIKLPGISGVEALHRIRGDAATVRLPVLMISGHASVAEAVEAVQAGATRFLRETP